MNVTYNNKTLAERSLIYKKVLIDELYDLIDEVTPTLHRSW